MKTITLTIKFDPNLFLWRAEITDSLNDTLHAIGQEMELNPDDGAYVGLDWEYDRETQLEGMEEVNA